MRSIHCRDEETTSRWPGGSPLLLRLYSPSRLIAINNNDNGMQYFVVMNVLSVSDVQEDALILFDVIATLQLSSCP